MRKSQYTMQLMSFSSKFTCCYFIWIDTGGFIISINDDVATTATSDEIDNHIEDFLNRSPKKKRNQTNRKSQTNTHSKEKRYACNKCDKSFEHKLNLSSHKAAIHKGIRPYACDQCDKSYTRINRLTYHKKRVHQKIRSHVCQQCDKRFFLAEDLRAHSLSHTGMIF